MTAERSGRRRRRPGRGPAVRWLAGLILVAVVFAVGVALGEALHDNPKPGLTVTSVSTVRP